MSSPCIFFPFTDDMAVPQLVALCNENSDLDIAFLQEKFTTAMKLVGVCFALLHVPSTESCRSRAQFCNISIFTSAQPIPHGSFGYKLSFVPIKYSQVQVTDEFTAQWVISQLEDIRGC